MKVAATFLGGAKNRLLPPSVPFRFFAAAAAFHVLLWLVLAFGASDLTHFAGGFGPTLAAIHLLTLGVLTTTAIGAGTQILPVATGQPLAAVWLIKLVFWLAVPGILILTAGMYAIANSLLLIGAGLTTIGLLIFGWLLAGVLRHAGSMPVVAAYGWVALASLIGAAALGAGLALNFQLGLFHNQPAVALAHMILGGFGFMGFLVLGFSQILIPMFALSAVPPRSLSLATFAAAVFALILGTFGALAGSRSMLALAAFAGLAAAGGHLWMISRVLASGLRKDLGLSFVLLRVGWIMLPLTLVTGLAALYPVPGHNAAILFGFLLLFGWLLTFLFGILQRILPFLASMFLTPPARGRKPIASKSAGAVPLKIHAACHLLALIAITISIVTDNALIAQIFCVVGLLGAVVFAWFTADIIRRLLFNKQS